MDLHLSRQEDPQRAASCVPLRTFSQSYTLPKQLIYTSSEPFDLDYSTHNHTPPVAPLGPPLLAGPGLAGLPLLALAGLPPPLPPPPPPPPCLAISSCMRRWRIASISGSCGYGQSTTNAEVYCEWCGMCKSVCSLMCIWA
jgi:hypothetical protein